MYRLIANFINMKKLLNELLRKWSCHHNWEQIYENNIYQDDKSKIPYKTRITYLCKKCGKFKQIEI